MFSIDLSLYELPKIHVVLKRREEQQVGDKAVAEPPEGDHGASWEGLPKKSTARQL